jgi:PBP1b-binding outer membrane lipoprotein LpoB
MNKSSQQGNLMPLKRLLLLASLLVGCAENDEQSKQHNTEAQNLNSENTELAHSPEAAVEETAAETVSPSQILLAEEQVNVETFNLKRGQTITHVLK